MKPWLRTATMSMVFSLGILVGMGLGALFVIVLLLAASVGSSGPH